MQEALPSSVAVRAHGVSKSFRLPSEQVHTLKERVVHPMRRRSFERLEALRDVSFDVERGECFGIVGRNGSGKSTLMKCLSGIYRADEGRMWTRGRLAPFIELGVGFNPELAAPDNVLLNAIMLGLTPAQARERYDDIIAFAELEEFVDLKLKNYSSGMQVRLAFAVMVHVDADVLLIDEVLAVGDAAFQEKCYRALSAARERGQTILLVSHDMDQVQRFCDRALLLERGRAVAIGDSGTVARRYNQLNFATDEERASIDTLFAGGSGTGAAFIVDTWAQDGQGVRSVAIEQGAPCAMIVRVRFHEAVDDPVFGFSLADQHARPVFSVTTEWDAVETGSFKPGDLVTVAVSFDNWFSPGQYSVSSQVTSPGGETVYASTPDAASVTVAGKGGGAVVDIPHQFHVNRHSEEPAAARGGSA
jgi:ABC-type polysaccharide/polyol phosphate transport system ATPase subunit